MTVAKRDEGQRAITIAISASVLYLLIPLLLAAIVATNEFKTNGQVTAVYPSVFRCIVLMIKHNPLWIILAILSAVAGGWAIGKGVIGDFPFAFGGTESAKAKNEAITVVAISGISLLLCLTFLFAPVYYPQEFSHHTMPAVEFDERKAAKGGYDSMIEKFYQPDPLYSRFQRGKSAMDMEK